MIDVQRDFCRCGYEITIFNWKQWFISDRWLFEHRLSWFLRVCACLNVWVWQNITHRKVHAKNTEFVKRHRE